MFIITIIMIIGLIFWWGDHSLDQVMVRDGNGNIYQLEHRVGDCYILNKININDIPK